ncbi:MAG TPA: PilZ domain-containing protein [Terriglobales bacterium]|nr:PilZ domain-containing protein [Terriglobales bacterium]
MGNRREPRKTVAVPVRIFGTDRDGKVFSENVQTIDVSRSGVKLGGVKAILNLDEIIGLSYGKNKVHFRLKWTCHAGTAGQNVGLLNLSPEKPLWDFPLPTGEVDDFLQQRNGERRRWPRVKCSISVEIRPSGQPVIWGKASDLSEGGCFVEMPVPLPLGSRFAIAVWLQETKLPLEGRVVSVAPGFGNGVCFLNVPPASQEHLRRFVERIIPMRSGGTLAFVKRSGL